MNLKKKLIFISCLVLGVCSILVGTIAYYSIVVSGNLTATAGTAVFVLKDSDDTTWNNKVISLNDGNKVNPGDSGSFTVKMDASGSSVDMYATLEIDSSNLPTNLKFYTTSDKRSELHKYYSLLETSNQVETITIYWYWNPYIDDEEDSKFINKSDLEAIIRVNAIQVSEYATMKNGANYNKITEEYTGTEFWNNTYRQYIRTINFENDLSNLPSECTEENMCWDISESENQKRKVYGYLVDSGEKDDNSNILYDLNIVSEAPIFAPSDSSDMFYNFTNLISIDFNNNFNTSNVTDMGYMFDNCSSLTKLDLSSFNTSNVTNMTRMFLNCLSLIKLDLSSFNTLKVTDMNSMFYNCSSLKELDISCFNTTSVENMGGIFGKCSLLIYLNLSNFNTSKVIDMNHMFYNCESLTELDLSSFNTSNVISMLSMFEGCSSLKELDLSSFNTSNVIYMGYMFYSCSKLASLDLSNFNTSNVTDMSSMFYNCSSLTTEINIMSTSVTSYVGMFYDAATATGSQIIVNYIADASDLVDNMIAQKSSNSNVVKGSQL